MISYEEIMKDFESCALASFYSEFETLTLHVVLSKICTLNCWYCFAHAGGSYDYKDFNPTEEHFINFATNIKNNYPNKKIIKLLLSGGEPLLKYKDFIKMIDIFSSINSDKKIRVMIQTNFLSNTESIYIFSDLMKKYENLSIELKISLHPSVIQDNKNFSIFLKNLNHLKDLDINTKLGILVYDKVSDICKKAYYQLRDLLPELDMYYIAVIDCENNKSLLSSEKIKELKIINKKESLWIKRKNDSEIYKIPLNDFVSSNCSVFTNNYCLTGFYTLRIRPNGEVSYICRNFKKKNNICIYDKKINIFSEHSILDCFCNMKTPCLNTECLCMPKVSYEKLLSMNFDKKNESMKLLLKDPKLLEKMNNSFSYFKK